MHCICFGLWYLHTSHHKILEHDWAAGTNDVKPRLVCQAIVFFLRHTAFAKYNPPSLIPSFMEIDRQTNCFFAFTKSSPTMICLQRIPNVMMPHPPTRNHHAHFYPRMLKCVGLMMIDMMCVTSGMTTPPKKKKSKKVAVLPRRNMNSRPTTTQVIQRYPEAFAVILAKSGLIGWVHPPPGMQRSPTSLTTYFFRCGDLQKKKLHL